MTSHAVSPDTRTVHAFKYNSLVLTIKTAKKYVVFKLNMI